MAVSSRRPALTVWIAWVVATAVGQAVDAAGLLPGNSESTDGAGVWIWSALAALPLAAFQFVVLRWLLNVERRGAAAWAVATVLAVVLSQAAYIAWFDVLMSHVSPAEGFVQDAMFAMPDYLYPLFVGVAQGVVLAIVLRRTYAAFVWVIANPIASAVASHVTAAAMTASGINFQTAPGGYAVPELLLWGTYGAVTGAALVALTRPRALPATAPAPAAR